MGSDLNPSRSDGAMQVGLPQTTHETQVLVVGGGPVGIGLAIELGQRGVQCLLVERYLQPQPIPKGQNLTQRTMEHFHSWGAEQALRAARTIPRSYGIGGLTAYGTLLGPYHYDWLQRDLVGEYYFTENERLPQYATETVLRDRVSQLDAVHTWFGWEASEITQDEDAVTVTVARHADPSARRTVRATFVVGCDGARSDVREQAGLGQTYTDHDRRMVLLVFRSHGLHKLLARYPGKSYFNVLQPELDGYWKFFGRVDLGSTWFFHAPVPRDTTADNFDFATCLHEAVGADFDIEVQHVGFWDLRFAIANRYGEGRAFIAGDAAHSHPPYGGYGVNSGLEDARNLGWKLAAVLQGWGGESLLDTYDAERRPVFDSTSRDFIAKAIETDRQFLRRFDPTVDRVAFEAAWQARAQGAVGEVNAFEPHYEGSPIVCLDDGARGVSGAVGSHSFRARPGHHLAPAMLSSGANIYETLGAEFTVLAVGAAAAAKTFAAAAAELNVPLTIVEDRGDSQTSRYEARLVLIRPDQFVAWVSDDPAPDSESVRHALAQSTALSTIPSAELVVRHGAEA